MVRPIGTDVNEQASPGLATALQQSVEAVPAALVLTKTFPHQDMADATMRINSGSSNAVALATAPAASRSA